MRKTRKMELNGWGYDAWSNITGDLFTWPAKAKCLWVHLDTDKPSSMKQSFAVLFKIVDLPFGQFDLRVNGFAYEGEPLFHIGKTAMRKLDGETVYITCEYE